MDKKINNIFVIITSLIILASSTLIGIDTQYYKYIQIISYLIVIVYFIIRIIKKEPVKIINNWLDICVITLVLSTSIPLIFGSYVSLYGSTQTVLEYIYVLGIYFLLRETTQINKGINKIMSNSLIIFTIILILIGIDGITSNLLTNLLEVLNIDQYTNGENRLISIFGYPNTLAVYITSILFLNINEALKQKNKYIKAIYKTITLIFIIGIILTYSKGIFIVLPLALFCYILRVKEKKIEIIINLFVSLIMAIIYTIVFEKLINLENYIFIWIGLAITIFINYIINIILEKRQIYIDKKIIIFGLFFTIAFVAYVIGTLNIYDEYTVFSNGVPSDYEAKIVNNIKGNETYILEFELESKAPEDLENTYTINIIERNSKNQELDSVKILFGTFEGNKQIKLETNSETVEIKIEFYSKFKYVDKSLIIKKLTINDKEIPLQYKYLPTKLVNKINDININYKTAKERIEIAKDGLQLAKENIITGIGGDGWKYKYGEVQDYSYISNLIHCYPVKVILEFGIVGLISYLGIAVCLIVFVIKNREITSLSIVFATIVILLHSVIDIDMEYTNILIIFFALSGIISANIGNTKKQNVNITSLSSIIIIIIMFISMYLTLDTKIYNKSENITELIKQQNGLASTSKEYREISYKMAKQYEKLLETEKYNYLDKYSRIIRYYLNSNSENTYEILQKYYEIILNYENKNKYNINYITQKIEEVYNIIKELEEINNSKYYEITEKFINIILNEYEPTVYELNKHIETQHIEDKISLSVLESIYEEIISLKNNYLCGVKIINENNTYIDEQKLEELEIEKLQSILIYHTHGTESYKSEEKYETYKFYRTLDQNYNVIEVGKYLKELLNENGIEVIHNTEYNDLPSTTGAYNRTRKIIEEELNKHPNINVIIDIHRDAYSEEEYEAYTVNINGVKVAPLRFVIGVNKQDTEWIYDLKIAIELQKIADKIYPGLFSPILIRERDYYNQDLSKYAILIEVGENNNYIDEALNSIKYFAEVISTKRMNEN